MYVCLHIRLLGAPARCCRPGPLCPPSPPSPPLARRPITVSFAPRALSILLSNPDSCSSCGYYCYDHCCYADLDLSRPSEGCSSWRQATREPPFCLSHPHVPVASDTPRSKKVHASSLAIVEGGTRVWQTPSRQERYPNRPCPLLSCGYRGSAYTVHSVENSNSEAAPFMTKVNLLATVRG